jgi:hypothetical protein
MRTRLVYHEKAEAPNHLTTLHSRGIMIAGDSVQMGDIYTRYCQTCDLKSTFTAETRYAAPPPCSKCRGIFFSENPRKHASSFLTLADRDYLRTEGICVGETWGANDDGA